MHSLQPAADGMRLQLSPLRHRRLAKPRLPAVPGKSYRVEYSEDLTQNQWHLLLDHIPGTGTLRTVIDPLGTTLPKCFYRVVYYRAVSWTCFGCDCVLYETHANADTHQSPRESASLVAAGARWAGNRDRV